LAPDGAISQILEGLFASSKKDQNFWKVTTERFGDRLFERQTTKIVTVKVTKSVVLTAG